MKQITRRFHLSRKGKTVRNFVLFLALLFLLWAKAEYPIPWSEATFRRAEQMYWAGPSEIQYHSSDWRVVAGVFEDQVVVQWGKDSLWFFPRNEDGPTLLPMDGAFLVMDVPKGTVSARLKSDLACYSGDIPYKGRGFTGVSRREVEEELGLPEGAPEVVRVESTSEVEGEFKEDGSVWFTPRESYGLDPSLASLLSWSTEHQVYEDPEEIPFAFVRSEAVFLDGNGNETGRTVLETPFPMEAED